MVNQEDNSNKPCEERPVLQYLTDELGEGSAQEIASRLDESDARYSEEEVQDIICEVMRRSCCETAPATLKERILERLAELGRVQVQRTTFQVTADTDGAAIRYSRETTISAESALYTDE